MTNGLPEHWAVAEMNRPRVIELAEGLQVEPLLAHLLTLRGVGSASEGAGFLNPCGPPLSEPSTLTDMDAAVKRIELARQREEHVLIFGDYDVDGIAGTAIMFRALRRYGLSNVSCDLPSRLTEGYGLHASRVLQAHQEHVDLIITVDNGIKAYEAADTARRLGIDLIVTDHHEIEGNLPDADAVINPKREGPGFPGADLCGAAVALKVAWALTGSPEDLDLAALGTVADVVPLRGENRTLAALGLREMAREPRIGLAALASAAGLRLGEVTSEQIAFQLAPRLNAAGRLGEESMPLRLLLVESSSEAARLARKLNSINEERRRIEKVLHAQAEEEIEASIASGQRSIVLGSRDWHPGVVGIVAARLQDKHQLPVVLVSFDDEGLGRGSARSQEAFDMNAALSACHTHLVRFGGHAAAAGLTVHDVAFAGFQEAFEEYAKTRARAEQGAKPVLDVDAIVSLSEISPAFLNMVERLQPFGYMNPSPVLCTSGARILPDSIRRLNGGHIKFSVRQGSAVLPVIGFNKADDVPEELAGQRVDIAFTPQFNTWNGETTIQLQLKDIR